MDGDTPREHLQLLEPQTEDWHCLVCMLTVSFILSLWLYSAFIYSLCLSYLFLGYLEVSECHEIMVLWGYFKSILNRKPVKKNPKNNTNACNNFLLTVVKGHLLTSVCTYLEVKNVDLALQLPVHIRQGSSDQQYGFVRKITAHASAHAPWWKEPSQARMLLSLVIVSTTVPISFVTMVH